MIYFIEKALDKACELIHIGYRKLDEKQSFLLAFENALSVYKGEYGEDSLYCKMYKNDSLYYCGCIKDIIDEAPATRELGVEIKEKLNELFWGFQKNIDDFLTYLFVELIFSEEYRDKIFKYRQDKEIGEMYKTSLEINSIINGKQPPEVKYSNNMFQYYLSKWNQNLFLHNRNKNSMRLKDLYVLPLYNDCNSYKSDKEREDLDDVIDLFLSNSLIGNRMRPMIILADAGMGKTSLISYICSKCPQKTNVLVLKFSDLHKNSLNEDIISSVLRELKCEKEDLRYQRLIIDGFDESEYTNNKNILLSNFLNDCQNIKGLKVLVTSRVNYVNYSHFNRCKLYYLKFMNEIQITKMTNKYFHFSKEVPFEIGNIAKKEVIGVPLILYMALSLKIHIESKTGICELYEKIFACDGGIIDRMAANDRQGYNDTGEIHPIAYDVVKQQVHLISQLIAFSMFEANSLILGKETYREIVNKVSEDRIEDFAISNYYYIESSTYSLTFCHKTIYEYFTAEYIYNLLETQPKDINCNNENLAKQLSLLLKRNLLTKEIIHFLTYKITKKYKKIPEESIKRYQRIESVVNFMIECGMTYFLDIKVMDILKTEKTIFSNILLILDIYKRSVNYKDYKKLKISTQFLDQLNNRYDSIVNLNEIILADNQALNEKSFLMNMELNYSWISNINFNDSKLNSSAICNAYLENVSFKNAILNLSNFYKSTLKDINMSNGDFSNCCFDSCNMSKINGYNTSFKCCSFQSVVLKDSDFKKAKFSGANFNNACLTNVNFNDADLGGVDFSGADLTGIDLHLAHRAATIKVNNETIFCYATVSSVFVSQLSKLDPNHLIGLKVYVYQLDKCLLLEEYVKIYGI